MNLLTALRFDQRVPDGSKPLDLCATAVAFTGAGGKTTAMFQLARQMLYDRRTHGAGCPAVLVSVTTHLATQQLDLGDNHHIISTPEEAAALSNQSLSGVVLLTGKQVGDDRVSGVDHLLLHQVYRKCQSSGRPLPMLIEADGSRRLPLKAPAAHEPPVPPWVDLVVVVAGLSGLGRPLTADWVHRPEIFSSLTGLKPGGQIEIDHLERVLLHPLGGLKNIPTGCRRVALLNQADTPELQAAGMHLAKRLKTAYEQVLIASLAPVSGTAGSIFAAVEPLAGIVLAAGGADRFGQPKQLLLWQGEPLVRRAARIALEAGLEPVVVVTGAYSKEVRSTLTDLPVVLVDNPLWEAGQGTSVALGVKALNHRTGAAIFLLADQPNVPVTLLTSLASRHEQTLAPVVAPLVSGQRSNPVLFDRQAFHDLAELTGDIGGRALFSRYKVEWLPWHDASVLLDIDRPEDYLGQVKGQ